MRFFRAPFFAAAIFFGSLPTPAHGGAYEFISEGAYRLQHGTCKEYDPARVNEKLMPALSAACEAGLNGEVLQILRETDGLTEALFFEAARDELYQQTTCSAKKVDALFSAPEAMKIYAESIRMKLPELKRLGREVKMLTAAAAIADDLSPGTVPAVDDEGKPLASHDPSGGLAAKLAEKKKLLKKTKAAYDTLLGTIPFSSYSLVQKELNDIPESAAADPKKIDKAVFKILKKLSERLPEQLSLTHPGQTLSITAKEDVLQNEEFANVILDKFALIKDDRKNLFCSLDARYGKGRAAIDAAFAVGGAAFFVNPFARGVGAAVQTARGIKAAERLQAIGSVTGRAALWAGGMSYVADTFRDFQRSCLLTSPDHLSSRSSKSGARAGCSADDVVYELHERDCASYFVFWGLAFNGARQAQKLVGANLLKTADRGGVVASGVLLNTLITRDILDTYLVPEEEAAAASKKKEPKAPASPVAGRAAPMPQLSSPTLPTKPEGLPSPSTSSAASSSAATENSPAAPALAEPKAGPAPASVSAPPPAPDAGPASGLPSGPAKAAALEEEDDEEDDE